MSAHLPAKPDYGVDAPAVMRNLFLIGFACLLIALLSPPLVHIGPVVFAMRSFCWPAGFLIGEGCLFLLYVKYGKFRHRDFILGMHVWRGDEQVLDVGCGRGLLLAGAAQRLAAMQGSGHATGIDIWSTVDMGGNAMEATQHNLGLESIASYATLRSEPAQQMSFADSSFDVIVSNLCLHNIYDRPTRERAVAEIVRVLKPGGIALLSDYKNMRQYAKQLQEAGLMVERRRGSMVTTFPPLAVVVARKS